MKIRAHFQKQYPHNNAFKSGARSSRPLAKSLGSETSDTI